MDLFEPLVWKNVVIPSRIIFAPINTGFTSDNLPTERLIRFHELRSSPSIGINFVGNVAVSREGLSNPETAILSAERGSMEFARLAKTISSRGSLAGIQLAFSSSLLKPLRNWRAKNIADEVERLRTIVTSIPSQTLIKHVEAFVQSAGIAADSGFSVIQIHAAHGYLLSLLLNPVINVRTDEFKFDGDWLIGFISNLQGVVRKEILLSFRLSVIAGIDTYSNELCACKNIIQRMNETGVDLIDLSAGFYTIDRNLIYPGRRHESPPYLQYAQQMAAQSNSLISVAGRITNLENPPSLLKNMLVSIGRSLIADPAFAQKTKDGRFAEINACCLKSNCHYFSAGRKNLACGVNPDI